ncbi:MAG: hypothetical protein IIX84_06795, partial [Oscillospiraceae bacterium]|nr:hypothetical protein [Oscillospiraceae bacterium]
MITHIVASSLLIAAIIGIRAAVRKKVSPRIVYGLWLIVLVKLCIPVSLWSVKLPEIEKPISETAQMGNFEIVTAEQSGDFEEVITISSPPVS